MTLKQTAFASEYLRNGRNAKLAFQTIYAKTGSGKSSEQQACRLLKHPKIAAVIAEADAKIRAALDKQAIELGITKERLSRELASMAFAPELRAGQDGDGKRIRPQDKLKALDLLARLHGHIVEKREVKRISGFADLSDEELKALMAEAQRDRDNAGVKH